MHNKVLNFYFGRPIIGSPLYLGSPKLLLAAVSPASYDHFANSLSPAQANCPPVICSGWCRGVHIYT